MLLCRLEDPIRAWQYAERYLGVGTRTYSPFAADLEISDSYHPQRAPASFAVPTFWVPQDCGAYLRNGVESALHHLYQDGERLLLPVHPEALAHQDLYQQDKLLRCEPGPTIEVIPSANARTVFVQSFDHHPVKPHFLKLHYPRRLSRFTRRLRRPIILSQLWVAEELARIGVAFLPEVGGGVFTHDPIEGWGFVLRELHPIGAPAIAHTVPLFALYGCDYRAPSDPSLVEQLVAASGESAEQYLVQRIVRPMVRLWLDVLLRTGCAIELHGQNTLFTFSGERSSSSIVYRDCAVYVDPGIRRWAGLGMELPPVNVISRDIQQPRHEVLSLTYDGFMGHHALAYLARLAHERLGLAPDILPAAARSEFAAFGGGESLLPQTVFYYDDALHPDGKWRLADTGEPPIWR